MVRLHSEHDHIFDNAIPLHLPYSRHQPVPFLAEEVDLPGAASPVGKHSWRNRKQYSAVSHWCLRKSCTAGHPAVVFQSETFWCNHSRRKFEALHWQLPGLPQWHKIWRWTPKSSDLFGCQPPRPLSTPTSEKFPLSGTFRQFCAE